MLGLGLILVAAAFLYYWLGKIKVTSTKRPGSARLEQAERYAARLFGEKHYLPAEKAYLDVLKLDHRNAAAYTHLGIIYSIQHNYPDAIEALELAARYAPSGTTYQYLAAAYNENKNFVKSVAAYEKSIMFEASASKYSGLSIAYNHLGSGRKAIESIQNAINIDSLPKYKSELAKLKSNYGYTDTGGDRPDSDDRKTPSHA